MHIVFFSPTSRGGHPAYVKEVMTALASLDKSLRLTLITRCDLSVDLKSDKYAIEACLPKFREKREFGLKVIWVLNRIFYYIKQDFLLIKYCMKHSVDIVHLQETTPIFSIVSSLIIGRVLGIKVFLTLHNVRPHKYPLLRIRRIVDAITSIRIACVDGLVVHTQPLKDLAVSICNGMYAEKIFIAPHGVWSYYKKSPYICNELPDGLFYFGVIRENKGLELFLDALILLAHDNIFVPANIFGKVEDIKYYESKLVPLICKLKSVGYPLVFEDRFLTHDEIVYHSTRSKFLVLPYTEFSAQSGVLFDAISLLIPVITTPGHSISDFVLEYGIGIVLKEASSKSLAHVIRTEIENVPLSVYRKRIMDIREKNTWVDHAEVLVECYKTLKPSNI